MVPIHGGPLNADMGDFHADALADNGFRQDLSAVRVPTLVIHGSSG